MGIKNYQSTLLALFPNITCQHVRPGNLLCIDVNTTLHEVCHRSRDREQFKRNLRQRLDQLINQIRPNQLSIFADGQAVLAKARTQIKRRNKYLYSEPGQSIDTLNLTPGTPFMDYVDTIIGEYLREFSIETHYSSSKVPNEGEIKMFQWMKAQTADRAAVIVGNDADIIVLSLLNVPLLNVFVYNNRQFVSIFKLVRSLSELSTAKFDFKYHPVRRDVGLLSLLSGNDYLDHLVNFNEALRAYRRFLREERGFLIDRRGQVDLANFKKLLLKIETVDNSIHTARDASEYLKSLVWNLKLYTEEPIPNYLSRYNKINLATLLKHFPREIELPALNPQWQPDDVYLLLLMPITGKELVPDHLRSYMDDDSPIRDLFPDPCQQCIEFKKEISHLNSLSESLDREDYRFRSSELNKKYRLHLDQSHSVGELPIKRIERVLSL
jgi:5'-3' exonuclease